MRRRSDQSARARSDHPYQLWHQQLDIPFFSTALCSSFSLFLFLSALLTAINPLSFADWNDAAIGGTLSHTIHVLVNLWMSTEAKSYRYLPCGLHEWPARRKSSAVVLVCYKMPKVHPYTCIEYDVRARVALLECECVVFLETRECVHVRALLCDHRVY